MQVIHTATTMIRGRANPQSNKFQLPRIPITHHTLPHLFLAKILTKYEDRQIALTIGIIR